MSDETIWIEDLGERVEMPEDGILTKTLQQDERCKVVLFGFAAGQELSEHTASVPAILHFLSGSAVVGLGGKRHDARAGSWVHMPAGMAHSIRAVEPTSMLLTMFKGG